MSVIVRGMEMPENCGKCPMYGFRASYFCYITGQFTICLDGDRASWCPLEEVQEDDCK